MATQQQKVIPAINTAALEAITDQNTRDVLRSIVDGLNVRNGQTGSGDNAFLTRADLANLGIKSSTATAGTGGQYANQLPSSQITPADVRRIINELQADVMASPLFQDLGTRIGLIDKPGTGLIAKVGAAEIGLANETTERVNQDNAIKTQVATQYAAVNQSLALVQQSINTTANQVAAYSQQLSTVQASLAGQSAAIQQESFARVTADGQLQAQYTVKVDVNGYVSGYGLASTASNDTPKSSFIVRADRFAVGSPSGPGIPPRVPFVVLSTAGMYNGVWYPAGTYLDQAFIGDATIGGAKIGVAQIDTLRLGNEVVTIPRYAENGLIYTGDGNWYNTLSYSFTMPYDGAVVFLFSGKHGYNNGGTHHEVRMYFDGAEIGSNGGDAISDYMGLTGRVSASAGTHTVYINWYGADNRIQLAYQRMVVLGVMR